MLFSPNYGWKYYSYQAVQAPFPGCDRGAGSGAESRVSLSNFALYPKCDEYIKFFMLLDLRLSKLSQHFNWNACLKIYRYRQTVWFQKSFKLNLSGVDTCSTFRWIQLVQSSFYNCVFMVYRQSPSPNIVYVYWYNIVQYKMSDIMYFNSSYRNMSCNSLLLVNIKAKCLCPQTHVIFIYIRITNIYCVRLGWIPFYSFCFYVP